MKKFFCLKMLIIAAVFCLLSGCVSTNQVNQEITDLQSKSPEVRQKALETLVSYGSSSVPQLLTLLDSERPEVRCIAITALGRIRNNTSIIKVVNMLGDSDKQVRAEAIKSIPLFGEDAIPALSAFAGSGNPVAFRVSAIVLLGETKSSKAIPGLLKMLVAKQSEFAAAAIKALITLQPLSINPLIEQLTSNDPQLRENAAAALLGIGESAVDSLLNNINDSNRNRQREIIVILGKLHPPRALPALASALDSPHPDIRFAAAGAMEHYGNSAVEILSEKLNDMQDSGDSLKKEALVIALGTIKSKSDVSSTTLATLVEDADPQIRKLAVKGLENTNSPAINELIKKAMKDSDWHVRKTAAGVLERRQWKPDNQQEKLLYYFATLNWQELALAGKDALPILKLGAEDSKGWVRQSAINTIIQIKHKISSPPTPAPTGAELAKKLKSSDWQQRSAAVKQLTVSAQSANQLIVITQTDPERLVRKEAVIALGKMKSPETITAVKAALADSSWMVRKAAVNVLVNYNLPDTANLFVSLLKDDNLLVRSAAAKALERLNWQADSPAQKAWLLAAQGRYQELAGLKTDALPVLKFILNSDAGDSAKMEALNLISRLKSRETFKLLFTTIADNQDLPVKNHAAKLLAETNPDAAAQFIILLKNPVPLTRKTAAEFLGKLEYKK